MTRTINIRVDEDIKKGAEKVFNNLGLSMSVGINVYLAQVNMKKAIPFELSESDTKIQRRKGFRLDVRDKKIWQTSISDSGNAKLPAEFPSNLAKLWGE